MCVIMIAMAFIALAFPAHFIDGTQSYWQAQTEDVTQYQAGLLAFIQEPWHWPLLRINSLNWPTGTLATFADIIPLYALALKALTPILPPWIELPSNPYGYWVGLCVILQAIAAWWILRAARINDGIALVCLTVFIMLFPAWLSRMGHISLLSQWLIGFALALCIAEKESGLAKPYAWLTLIMVSSLINIYLCAMLCCMGFAQALQWRNCMRAKQFQYLLASAIGLCGLELLTMIWPLPKDNGIPDGGYALYSLNVLAPVSGTPQNLLHFSSASPQQAFEGFNYLGVGGLLLIVCAALCMFMPESMTKWFRKKTANEPLHQTPARCWLPLSLPVLCALVLMACYALSNQIFIGKSLLIQWPEPRFLHWLTGQFRASGRFFWPLGYALLVCSFLVLIRKLPRRAAHLIFILALSVQVLDLWPQIQTLQQLKAKTDAQVISFAQWQQQLPALTQHLYFYPKMRCATQSDLYHTLLPVMLFAAQERLTINTAYLARYTPTCHQEASEIAQSNPQNSVYIFTQQDYSQQELTHFFPRDWKIQCHTQDFAWLCSRVD